MQFVKLAKKAFLVEELFDQDRPVFERQSLFLFSFQRKPTNPSQGRPRLSAENVQAIAVHEDS